MFKYIFNFIRRKIKINMTAKEFLEEREMYNHDIEDVVLEYTKLKCQELLLLVAEKARIIEDGDVDNPYEEYFLDLGGSLRVDKDSILNVIDLEKFCGGTPSS